MHINWLDQWLSLVSSVQADWKSLDEKKMSIWREEDEPEDKINSYTKDYTEIDVVQVKERKDEKGGKCLFKVMCVEGLGFFFFRFV